MVGRNRETFRREDVRPTLKNPSAAGREFFFTRAVYRDGRGWRGESWATDYPKADRVLSEYRAAANLESPHPTLVEFDQGSGPLSAGRVGCRERCRCSRISPRSQRFSIVSPAQAS